jgi:septum formation protein
MTLVLASGSATRRRLLSNAGLEFEVVRPEVDERAAEQPLLQAGGSPEALALLLAGIKATTVSLQRPADHVIGADQVLELDGRRLVKPVDIDDARRQLLALSGRTHHLRSAVACARSGEVVWHHCESARLSMRHLTPADVGRYLAAVGLTALDSVGAYQIEGRGVRLFDKIEGDYFAILGLPMLPLLAFLREQGLLP